MNVEFRKDLYKVIDTKAPACEVGVANGIFAQEIHSWGVPLLYLVDTWKPTGVPGDGSMPLEWHENNLKEVMNRELGNVVLLQGLSADMAHYVEDDSLGFVYLDACHLQECVIEDLLAWYPKLKVGGVMAGHDIFLEGVKGAVTAFTKGLKTTYNIVSDFAPEHSSFWFNKL